MTPKLPKPSEHNEQAAFVDYMLWTYRNNESFIRPLFFAVPNGAWLGGKKPAYVMEKLKGEGVFPGVSDILYLQPRGRFSCLSIEMKTPDRVREKFGGLTDNQREFLKAVAENGGYSRVCYGSNEAIVAFDYYMALPLNIVRSED